MGGKRQESLSMERLRDVLNYNQKTGEFVWKQSRGGHAAGSVAGSVKWNGYRYICIDGVLHQAHRLAWFYVNGSWPSGEIDHRKRKPDDNRIAKLREASRSQNAANYGLRKDNRSGIKGVAWDPLCRKWRVQIQADKKRFHIGVYVDIEDAAKAYAEAAGRFFGEYANPARRS